jgi:hypothetical protein
VMGKEGYNRNQSNNFYLKLLGYLAMIFQLYSMHVSDIPCGWLLSVMQPAAKVYLMYSFIT